MGLILLCSATQALGGLWSHYPKGSGYSSSWQLTFASSTVLKLWDQEGFKHNFSAVYLWESSTWNCETELKVQWGPQKFREARNVGHLWIISRSEQSISREKLWELQPLEMHWGEWHPSHLELTSHCNLPQMLDLEIQERHSPCGLSVLFWLHWSLFPILPFWNRNISPMLLSLCVKKMFNHDFDFYSDTANGLP